MSVLVFEDDPLMLELYRRVLRGFGRVRAFSRAEDGLDELSEATLLVTDLEMPGMGGLALLQRRDPNLPTVVVSGSADLLGQVPRGPHLRVLEKPFRMAAFYEAVCQATSPT